MAKQQKQVNTKCGGFESTSNPYYEVQLSPICYRKRTRGERERRVCETKRRKRERDWSGAGEGDRGKKMNHVQTLLIPRGIIL